MVFTITSIFIYFIILILLVHLVLCEDDQPFHWLSSDRSSKCSRVTPKKGDTSMYVSDATLDEIKHERLTKRVQLSLRSKNLTLNYLREQFKIEKEVDSNDEKRNQLSAKLRE